MKTLLERGNTRLAPLDTVEPLIWLGRNDISWAKSGVANGIGQFSFVQRDSYDIPMTLFAPHKQAVKELAELRGKVESLLAECRKEARKEALLEAEARLITPLSGEEPAGFAWTRRHIRDELRRMAEGEK